MDSCIFCRNNLNGSDEHIIPQSLNGKLHSKDLICTSCNNKFGANIDYILKDIFNPLLHMCGFKNASPKILQDPDGRKYKMNKGGKIHPIRPILKAYKQGGKLHVNISGERKSTFKMLERTKSKFAKAGIKELSHEILENALPVPPLSYEYKIEVSPLLILALKKIAIEFYAYCGLDIALIQPLINEVSLHAPNMDNVYFGGWHEGVRGIENGEVSHLLILHNDIQSGTLYCYIELFNVICCAIPLTNSYTGKDIAYYYHQDAISSEKKYTPIQLDLGKIIQKTSQYSSGNFSILIGCFIERLEEYKLKKAIEDIISDVRTNVMIEAEKGLIDKELIQDVILERSLPIIAKATIYEFPYLIEDFKDESNNALNFIHSNMSEENYMVFCKANEPLLGVQLYINKLPTYTIESFHKSPYRTINSIKLFSVSVVIKHLGTEEKLYIPHRDFIQWINSSKSN